MPGTQHIVIVGGGFGGAAVARRLERLLPASATISVINPTTSQLFSPLLSVATAGLVEPRHALIPLRRLLRRSVVVRGTAGEVNIAGRTIDVRLQAGGTERLHWDRLVLAPGSIARPSNAPGVAVHSRGLKSLGDAMALRTQVAEQLELAEAATELADRRRHATFVVVGAGYAGTEVTAELHAATTAALRLHPRVRETGIRWLLVQRSDRVLPQLGDRLGEHALQLLRRRGVDVRLDTTIEAAGPGWVRLSRGEIIPTETLVWTAGVRADPWASRLGIPVDRHGRIIVDESLAVPGFPGIYALGDAARVPQHGERDGYAPPTATHATRQAVVCAENIAESFGTGGVRTHRHHDRSLFVNLGRRHAVASVSGVPLHGLLGWAATVTHRVTTLPVGSRRRVAFDWLARSGSVADLSASTQYAPQLMSLPGVEVSERPVGPEDVALAAP